MALDEKKQAKAIRQVKQFFIKKGYSISGEGSWEPNKEQPDINKTYIGLKGNCVAIYMAEF
ncbi:hypothetical protein [Mucilaginibacter sp.]|uniref:hypothetical protein n=1 Tax=Mucilaginibacter sp. TaxID=1882438 RepID=UPI00283D7656|nr:hypothetical protein [Mucilaginibacter sp.]MDR3697590.1 hypothetical protein [Mucilaginibacter sp.]